jgi:hypothetical protein
MAGRKYLRYSVAGMMILVAVIAVVISLVTPRASKWTIYQATAIDVGIKNVMYFDSTARARDLDVKEVEETGQEHEYTVVIRDRRTGKLHRVRTFMSRPAIESFQRLNPTYRLPPIAETGGPA